MNIQEFTVSEQKDRRARVDMLVADDSESEDFVSFSVLVATAPNDRSPETVSLTVLQVRALKEAIALLGQVEDALVNKRP